METVSWPVGVNRIILSSTSLNHNRNAVVSDKSENGSDMGRLNSSSVPDEWKVSMSFSNSRKNSYFRKHGETELETFIKWFKYTAQMGTIAFRFGSILDSSDSKGCIYKIKADGMPSYTFNGNKANVTMTWQEQFDDFISVYMADPMVDSMFAYNGHVELWYAEKPDYTPNKSNFAFRYSFNGFGSYELVMEDFIYDGNKTCVFYYPEFTESGVYEISLDSGSWPMDRFEV